MSLLSLSKLFVKAQGRIHPSFLSTYYIINIAGVAHSQILPVSTTECKDRRVHSCHRLLPKQPLLLLGLRLRQQPCLCQVHEKVGPQVKSRDRYLVSRVNLQAAPPVSLSLSLSLIIVKGVRSLS